jgi:hypothetical protein
MGFMGAIVFEKWTRDAGGKEHLSRQAVECPSGRRPEDVAAENGGILVDYYSSLTDAKYSISRDQNG